MERRNTNFQEMGSHQMSSDNKKTVHSFMNMKNASG
jgi:hypothetical protein